MAKAQTELKPVESVDKKERETTMDFLNKIEMAIIDGEEWVETSPEIIAHYNKRGLKNCGYFIFRNIKVCEYGQSEKIQEQLDADIHRLMHGAKEAVFEGRT